MSSQGLRVWLGECSEFRLEKGFAFKTAEGVTGRIRDYNPGINIRLSWMLMDWPKPSILQMRVIPAGEKSTINFHHENLPDRKARSQVAERWKSAMDILEEHLTRTFRGV